MRLLREEVPVRVSIILGRPARWVPRARLVGDFEGRERTMEVFLADVAEQRALLRALRPARAAMEAAAGGPLVVIFHTPDETARLYPEVLLLDALRGVRAEARAREWAVQVTPVPTDEGAAVRLIHGVLEVPGKVAA